MFSDALETNAQDAIKYLCGVASDLREGRNTLEIMLPCKL